MSIRSTGYPIIALAMTDEDIVRRFAEIVNAKVFGPYTQNGGLGHKPMWRIVIQNKSHIIETLEPMYPYFGQRRRTKADEVLALARQPNKQKPRKDQRNQL